MRDGTSGDWGRRLLRHHLPLALASSVVLVLFIGVPMFDADTYPHADLSGAFPRQRQRPEIAAHAVSRTAPPVHRPSPTALPSHVAVAASSPSDAPRGSFVGPSTRGFTVASGYLATGLLGLTLFIGPANLLLRRRNPVSSYLRRDVGTWTAMFSVVHVIFGLQVHARLADLLTYFLAPDGRPLVNSFGLGNWTGLAALAIVAGLLALSSDAALRTLRAKTWKWLQRLNYVLFALVIVHAFFYGALERTGSPYTSLLLLSVIAVFGGQVMGVWLYRARHSVRGTQPPLLAS